ncbi:MAG: DUF4924 family protein [Bacteroidaceae bacterium]|nr:DUF4924 family protein [Candidatus Minthousia equi]MCQ2246659.1 DUF4924 family protein [Bacteroidaceae bacterium]MDO4956666.1 DUF4924 family protein [Bacteroidales bacterium]
MFISQELKKNNINEYLLYMWQVEDIIRAYGCDADRLAAEYVPRFTQYTPQQQKELAQWYADLVEMMRSEGVMQSGHLQINKNIILLLTDLHNEVLKSPKHPFYSAAYYKALPFIVEIRSRGNNKEVPELENCFEALYGLMLLRLQKKEISAETLKAVEAITQMLGLLAGLYKQEKEGSLEL